MSDIKTSIHGISLGLDDHNRTMARAGFVSGNIGSSRHDPSPIIVADWDDFLGDTVDARWDAKTGSDGGVITPTINVQQNGVFRMTTGAGAGATMAVNGVQFQGALNWKAPNQLQTQHLCIEARFRAVTITTLCLFFGFTSQTAALQMPIQGTGGGDAFTANNADAVGVLYDTTMTTKNWWGIGDANSVLAPGQNFGLAPVANTFETWRLELATDNSATGSQVTFYRNGLPITAASPASNIGALLPGPRNSVSLTPVLAAFSRAAASNQIECDYIHINEFRV